MKANTSALLSMLFIPVSETRISTFATYDLQSQKKDINDIICRDYYAGGIPWSLPSEETISGATLTFCTVCILAHSDRLTVADGSINSGSRNNISLIDVDVSENIFGFAIGPECYCNNKIALTDSAVYIAESSTGFLLGSSILGLVAFIEKSWK